MLVRQLPSAGGEEERVRVEELACNQGLPVHRGLPGEHSPHSMMVVVVVVVGVGGGGPRAVTTAQSKAYLVVEANCV